MPRFFGLIVLVLIGWVTQLEAQSPLFKPAPGSPVEVGLGSGQIVLADVNGDGHLDLLTQHLLSQLVAIQLGDGTGRFSEAADSPLMLDYPPGGIELGDLNNDGVLDMGITRTNQYSVDIFLGNGQGGFSLGPGSPFIASSAIYTPTKPGLHLMDVNQDGNLDFVTTNRRHNTIATLLGDGHGKFTRGPVTRLVSSQDLYSIAFGDVDGDRHLDLVIATNVSGSGLRLGHIVIQRGDGTGAFKNASRSAMIVSPDPRIATLADMNGDQHLDLVINHDNGRLSVMLNKGNGTFGSAPASSYLLATPAFAVVASDVNQDARLDLVAATVNSRSAPFNSTVTVLLGDGRGYVSAPGSPFRVGAGAYHLTLGDVNQDGKPDIASSSFEGNTVSVLLGQ